MKKTNTIKEWKNSKHQSEFNGLYTFSVRERRCNHKVIYDFSVVDR
ncbi:hypothetical protein ACT7DB_33155 [Bacillus cereus]